MPVGSTRPLMFGGGRPFVVGGADEVARVVRCEDGASGPRDPVGRGSGVAGRGDSAEGEGPEGVGAGCGVAEREGVVRVALLAQKGHGLAARGSLHQAQVETRRELAA